MKKTAFYLILISFVVVTSEIASYFVAKIVDSAILGARGILLSNDVSSTAHEVAEYFATRDPVVGWPTSVALRTDRYDETGARRSPAYPATQAPCAATFGDSFTFAAEVSDADAWPNQLSAMLDCRVANYGVGGYGTDQAMLRFLQTEVGPASIIVLGLFPQSPPEKFMCLNMAFSA